MSPTKLTGGILDASWQPIWIIRLSIYLIKYFVWCLVIRIRISPGMLLQAKSFSPVEHSFLEKTWLPTSLLYCYILFTLQKSKRRRRGGAKVSCYDFFVSFFKRLLCWLLRTRGLYKCNLEFWNLGKVEVHVTKRWWKVTFPNWKELAAPPVVRYSPQTLWITFWKREGKWSTHVDSNLMVDCIP